MLKRANPNTIHDKVLVGYQGWFTCAGDGEPIGPGHHGWLHWFNQPIPSGGRPNTDYWPDTSEYDPSELYPAPGLALASGEPSHLFSSRHPRTVRRHFHWMALHGVDGAFLQRFAGQCEIKQGNLGIRDLRDEVGDRVREAAEAEGRVFAIMYDVSGVSPDKIKRILEQDWMHLLEEKRLLDSPNYLREQGRPVVALWGFGFNDRNYSPELVREITKTFRSSVPEGLYLVAGTPGHWRTSSSDADRNPEFVRVWTECFDAICPWTVGRYANEQDADRWGEERVKADAEYLKKLQADGGRRVDYIPVVLPGGSGFNLSQGKWAMNDIQRNGGRFLWRQIYNAQRAGVHTIYCAMWDEYDEGTAFMPIVSKSSQVPVHPSFKFLALDVDGHHLPPDWYMRIAGFAAEAFHGERVLVDSFPYKELEDYWSTRPHYESERRSSDVDNVTQAFRQWEVSQANVPDDAPPPYSEEDISLRQGGRTGRPLVPVDTRPSQSHSSSLGGASAAVAGVSLAAAVAHTSSPGGNNHGSSKHPFPPIPPRVNISSRPLQRPGGSPSPGPTGMGMGLPVPHPISPASSGALPPGIPPRPAHHMGHVSSSSSFGRTGNPVGFPVPNPVPVEHAWRERSRSRSRSRSQTRNHEHVRQAHSHGHSHRPSQAAPYASGGMYMPAYAYVPHQSHPLGYGGPGGHAAPAAYGHHGHGQGGYELPAGHHTGHGGHGQGQGYNYGTSSSSLYQPGAEYGYVQHPPSQSYVQGNSLGSGPSASASASANGGVGGIGGMGKSGLVTAAFDAVEGIAGRQRREQLEKKVMSFTNKLK